MKLILQQTLNNEELASVADKLEIEYSWHGIVPFSDIVNPIPDIVRDDLVVFGSRSLLNYFISRGKVSSIFTNSNFTYSNMLNNLDDKCLNNDAIITRFDSAEIFDIKFIRPNKDDKSFAGSLITREGLKNWQRAVSEIPKEEFSMFYGDELVVLASPKILLNEYRVFIVDGKVSTGSLYKKYDLVYYGELPQKVSDFALDSYNIWHPHECCVLDIAETAYDGLKIIEYNCMNDSGFYKANLENLLVDLERYINSL